ncbi:MAG: hypothetical protein Q7U73_10510 [Rubrivivax sp.]|nr:hypothetical protein [Rubrivivax sp.]
MNSKYLAAFTLAGVLAAGAAHAGNRAEVQWAVTIGSPQIGVVVGSPLIQPRHYVTPVYAPRVYAPQVYVPQVYAPRAYAPPVYVVPGRAVHRTGWHDADRDGIPNRYDRVYNPRWDRDGDGVPNRYDRRDDRRHDRRDVRHDHRDDRNDRRHGR